MAPKKITACILAILLAVGVSWQVNKVLAKETFRNAKVIETEGEAFVEREKNDLPVYEQMMIQGGDIMTTGEAAQVALGFDDDKYLLVEENTKVEFKLEGNKEKGLISLNLEEGAVYNEIENPLAEDDSYEIHTPDGVMAVRGTKFRVSVREDQDGSTRETSVIVLDGNVYVQLNNSSKEEVTLQAGQEAVIEKKLDPQTGQELETEAKFTKKGESIDFNRMPEYISEIAGAVQSESEETASQNAVASQPTASPTPIPTVALTSSPTWKPTATPTPSPSPTPEPTATPTPEPTATPTPSPSPTPEPTATPTPSPSPTPEVTPTDTPITTPEVTPTDTPITTPEVTPTETEDSSQNDPDAEAAGLVLLPIAMAEIVAFIMKRKKKP